MEFIRKTHGTHRRILRRVISPYEDWPNLRRANHPPKNGNEDFEPETAREHTVDLDKTRKRDPCINPSHTYVDIQS